jgi:hypothetical protein
MPTRNASNGTQIEPSLVSRIAAGLRYGLTGQKPNEWMGPFEPMTPVTQEAERPSVAGRQFDYPVGFNVNTRPRASEAIGFSTLRALADNFDVLRLVIETRKDQLCSQAWSVVPRDKATKPDARCLAAEAFLRQPDQEHDWPTWLRMLLEDLFVLDAPALYVRRTLGGELWALEPIDGSTINRVIDVTGRTPSEGPAYQQILKGVPAINYTREELIYKPRNVRTHKVYGYGPVEQIINTVNIALRRQQFTLNYFTEGTVPDALAGVPVEWSTAQISEFQQYWDMLLQDDMASRRKLKFVPGEIARNFHEVKQPPLKDMFDEWIARIVCYCFSIDATPFVAQVNRSVAETNREQSLSEGLGPSQAWVKSTVDKALALGGWGELELAWQEGEIVDPLKRQQILCAYVSAKVLHPDEARETIGRAPLTLEQKADMAPPPVVTEPGEPGEEGAGKPPPKGKAPPGEDDEEAPNLGKALRPAGKLARAQKQLQKHIEQFLAKQAPLIAAQMGELLGIAKDDSAANLKRRLQAAIDGIDFTDWDEMALDAQAWLEIAAVAGANEAATAIPGAPQDRITDAHEAARGWARERSAEMVGRKWVGDKLLPNPDARWQITEGTRELIRGAVEEAFDAGTTVAELADALAESHAFSAARAETIARTETRKAQMGGGLASARTLGATHKEWSTSRDDKVSEECVACEDAGEIGLEEAFPGGEEAPPNHPNCRCVLKFSIRDEAPIEQPESTA